MIDTKSKIFFVILALITLASVGGIYYRYIVQKSYYMYTDENDVPAGSDILTNPTTWTP